MKIIDEKSGKVMYRLELKYREKNIRIKLEPTIARVYNDPELREVLRFRLSNAVDLARRIRIAYRKRYDTHLYITTLSLGIEILGHVIVQDIFQLLKKAAEQIPAGKKLSVFCDRMILHMYVIDCGEKYCDTNRFIWDGLAAIVKLFKGRKGVH